MLDDLGRHGLAVGGHRGSGGNLHGNVAAVSLEALGSGVDALDVEGHQNADLAATVDVGGDAAGIDGGGAGELDVLAQHVDGVGEDVLDGLALEGGGAQSLDVGGLGSQSGAAELLGVGLELLVHAHEVGLAVQLDDGGGLGIIGQNGHDGALVGGTAGLLGGSGQTAGAQHVDSLLHIAIGLDERLLALHHAGVGHLAQFLDHGSGDSSHVGSFLSLLRRRRKRRR